MQFGVQGEQLPDTVSKRQVIAPLQSFPSFGVWQRGERVRSIATVPTQPWRLYL